MLCYCHCLPLASIGEDMYFEAGLDEDKQGTRLMLPAHGKTLLCKNTLILAAVTHFYTSMHKL